MIEPSHLGFQTQATTIVVDRWRVQLFCEAIGETASIYLDEAAARDAGYPASPVPPTYLRAVEADHFSAAGILAMLNIPVKSVLHAEQSFVYHAPAHIGDAIEVTRTLTDSYDKRDGALTFIVLDSRFRREGEMICESRQIVCVRNPKGETVS